MRNVIVTGFEPFGQFQTNPSQQIAERLHGREIGGCCVHSLILPVEFGADVRILFPAIAELHPNVVMMLGLAHGIAALHIERLGINLRAGDTKDNDVPILAGEVAAYFATVDVDHIVAVLGERGVPARANVNAGNYLCNHLLYRTLHLAATGSMDFKAGFIHLPPSREQAQAENVSGPSLPLALLERGVVTAIEAAW